MTSNRDRYAKARLAGSGHYDEDRWLGIVDNAIDAIPDRSIVDDKQRWETMRNLPDRKPVWLNPGDMVVRATDILAIEVRLVEALQTEHELMDLINEDTNAARRDRMLRALDGARKAALNRLSRMPS